MRLLTRILSGIAFLGAATASVYLLTATTYAGIATGTDRAFATGSDSAGQGMGGVQFSETFVEANGAWGVGLLLVVTLATAAPLVATYASLSAQRAITWLIALLLLAFSVLAGFTIGLFFLPSALVLVLAAILTLLIRNDSPDEGGIQRSAW
jgi:hypothetical protein